MKCKNCGIEVTFEDGEICANCLKKVNKRLFEVNEKLTESEKAFLSLDSKEMKMLIDTMEGK